MKIKKNVKKKKQKQKKNRGNGEENFLFKGKVGSFLFFSLISNCVITCFHTDFEGLSMQHPFQGINTAIFFLVKRHRFADEMVVSTHILATEGLTQVK